MDGMADIFEVTGDFGGINKIKKINKTSSAGSATLEDTSLARLTSELIICFGIRWGGHRTSQFGTSGQMFKLGWGH